MQAQEQRAAEELAKRIEVRLTDPAKADESKRPPEDQPPGFADALMSEKPISIERSADLSSTDWALIGRALEHYAACGSA
ncbi:MAG: hypothetical protein JO359_06935 [Candidatus Eremiobacteraeota bacterium]|nr:hypothetical protein [Candidatus Eremiobacteraeota bacterium]